MSASRQRALSWAINKIGAPYVWKAKGRFLWTSHGLVPHEFGKDCFDCSGFVTSGLLVGTGFDWRATHSAQTIWDTCPKTDSPSCMSVACYGFAGKCEHVMFHVSDGVVFGASGGETSTTSPQEAEKLAKETGRAVEVHSFQSHLYRGDFLGWVNLPFSEE